MSELIDDLKDDLVYLLSGIITCITFIIIMALMLVFLPGITIGLFLGFTLGHWYFKNRTAITEFIDKLN